MSAPTIGVVIIGRNEAARLAWSLESVRAAGASDAVYVDSDSSDDSVEIAERLGFRVIRLESGSMSPGRARQAGWQALDTEFVFFLDGDSALRPEFFRSALNYFDDPSLAVVFGTLRDREPELSFFHRMNDRYIRRFRAFGEGALAGGMHLWRRGALERLGGFDVRLVVSENTELGERAREADWRVLYVDHWMAVHDLGDISSLQFFRRAARFGAGLVHGFRTLNLPVTALWRVPLFRGMACDAGLFASALLGVILLGVFDWRWSLGWLLLMVGSKVLRVAYRERSRSSGLVESLLCGLHETMRAIGSFVGLVRAVVLHGPPSSDWRR